MSAEAGRPPSQGGQRQWQGDYVRYDLVKELVIALGVITGIAVLLTILFSSPDVTPVTLQSWAKANPKDFVATAVTELDGTSEVATYGPPYNHTSGSAQKIGPISLQELAGVHHPINTSQDYVIKPLSTIPGAPTLTAALAAYQAASPARQKAWTTAYTDALAKARYPGGAAVLVPPGRYGPVALMMSAELALAQTGGLDGALLGSGSFYQTNYTKPLLFLSAGTYFEDLATAEHLLGTQWGMMNETGSFPGQVWLWLYTTWYQIEPFKSSPNADALIFALMGVLSLAFICIPFIPGIKTLPRHLGVYRLIWRDHYRRIES